MEAVKDVSANHGLSDPSETRVKQAVRYKDQGSSLPAAAVWGLPGEKPGDAAGSKSL